MACAPLPLTAAGAVPRVHIGHRVGALEGGVLAQVPLVKVTHVRLKGDITTEGLVEIDRRGGGHQEQCIYRVREYHRNACHGPPSATFVLRPHHAHGGVPPGAFTNRSDRITNKNSPTPGIER